MRSITRRVYLVLLTLRFASLVRAEDTGNSTVAPPDDTGREVPAVTATPNVVPPPGAGSLPAGSTPVLSIPEVVVRGRQDNLIGVADSASEGVIGATQLADRPILRSGELLETAPGMIITQHAGGGKANQYFLRGFSLDHGTDFAVFLDGMPLNLPSHAHGEGYADMNVVIPELVERINYEKGPYYADVGNYGSAGSAHLVFYRTLPQNFATVEGGMFGYARGVFGISQKLGAGDLLYGGEAYHDDGPWKHPDDYRKFNGQLTYSQGNDANGFGVTARGYYGKWNSSDQIPTSAVPFVGVFGTLNPSDGGNSQRYSLQADWHRYDENSETHIVGYGFYYDLDLFSDFTYFLTDTTRGDQFEQPDTRWVGGVDARHTIFNEWAGRAVETTFGVQLRDDWIRNALYQTDDRTRVDKLDTNTFPAAVLPATTQRDHFTDTQFGFWAETKVQWASKCRSVLAMRGDLQYFDVTSLSNSANSGTSTSLLPSPKLSVIVGPWAQTEAYLQGGFGFHSNDGRGTTQTVEPISADYPYPDTPAKPIPGLIQTKGAEIGARTLVVPHLQSTVSLWYLHSDSELQQNGDTGGTVPSVQPSNRYGIEWASYFTPLEHLAFDLDVADSTARFVSVDSADAAPTSPGSTVLGPGGKHVPEAVGWVVASGVTVHEWNGLSSSLRLRYFGPRDLTSDGIFQSSDTVMLNAAAGYRLTDTWRIGVEVLNLLNRRDRDIEYAYASRATPTSPQAFEHVFHPVEPTQVRAAVTARF